MKFRWVQSISFYFDTPPTQNKTTSKHPTVIENIIQQHNISFFVNETTSWLNYCFRNSWHSSQQILKKLDGRSFHSSSSEKAHAHSLSILLDPSNPIHHILIQRERHQVIEVATSWFQKILLLFFTLEIILK